MENIFKTTIETPVGYLEIITDEKFLLAIKFIDNHLKPTDFQPNILKETINQIEEYFRGIRKQFNLQIKPAGTEFQSLVWEQVKQVQYGTTVSYLDIAIKTGSKNNTRAVGLANGKNPIPLIIPCHRVIGANGNLTGYSGGLERKKWLLRHENEHSTHSNLLF